jgi:hypothetical protein
MTSASEDGKNTKPVMRVKKFLLAAIMVIILLSLFLELLATAQQTSSVWV